MTSSHPHSIDLLSLGWDAQRAAEFDDDAARGLIPGRVSRVDRGRCDVLTDDGPIRASTVALGRADTDIVTGDWVALSLAPTPDVVEVLPRGGAMYRATADRTSRRQALVANVDTVVVATALTARLRPAKIERLLALAWDSGAAPLVVLTKADAFDGDPEVAAAEFATSVLGVDVVAISSLTGAGLDEVRRRLRGTTVVLGASGVGKSTLVNALLGVESMATGDVREVDDKGRHTTVTRELFPIPGGGVLIDTPGLRGIGLHDADDGIEKVYADIEALIGTCRFVDCSHRSEPGCAVLEAIDDGDLDADRFDRYEKMLRESRWAATRGDAREERRRRDEWKAVTKHQRATYRFRERNGR